MERSDFDIYLVDDDKIFISETFNRLSGLGYTVYCFDNAKDFIEEYIGETKPSIVFLDINMPVINGMELLDSLKNSTTCIPVIITATNDVNVYKKLIANGAFDYLTKPVTPINLINTINTCIHRYQKEFSDLTLKNETESVLKTLTKKENQVLDLYINGETKDAIAEKLSISKNTLDVHRRNILKKFNSKSFIEVINQLNRDNK